MHVLQLLGHQKLAVMKHTLGSANAVRSLTGVRPISKAISHKGSSMTRGCCPDTSWSACRGQSMDTTLNGVSSIAGVMEEMGYRATVDEAAVKGLLNQFPTVTVEDTARVLTMMACTRTGLQSTQGIVQASLFAAFSNLGLGSGPQPDTWNARLFITCLQEKFGNRIAWQQIPYHLDHPGFNLPDASAFELLMEYLGMVHVPRFPLDALVGRVWRNAEGQLSMLRQATTASQHVFSFAQAAVTLPHLDSLTGRYLVLKAD